jgi:trimeric autotransporter adhesin
VSMLLNSSRSRYSYARAAFGGRVGILERLAVMAILLSGVSRLEAQPSATVDRKFWMTDGPVNAILVTNDSIYLGGDFTYVGPRTGPAGLFDQASGELLTLPPQFNGIVRAVVSDGKGGWYVGGSFTSVGGFPMTNLVHLAGDLSVDTSWIAAIQGTAVNALALDAGRLYIGGSFQRIGGIQISGLAGMDIASRQVTWNPLFSGTAYALKVANGLVYVGGNFYSVGNSNVQNVAAISTNISALATGWNPQPDQTVLTIETSGNNVYIGGQFTTAGTKPRNRLAALDATTGVATTWNPNPNGIVRALGVAGNAVYVGGDFTTIGGQNRKGFAAVNSGNGAAQSLDVKLEAPAGAPQGVVRSILIAGDSLYIGGSITAAFGNVHRLLAGVSITTGQEIATPAGSDFNGSLGAGFGINAMAVANGKVFAVGDFQSMGGVPRQRAAALSVNTGSALAWAPTFTGPVRTLAYGTNRIYVGGSFTNANAGGRVNGLAIVDPDQGNRIPGFNFLGTNQYADVSVTIVLQGGDKLYVGGDFPFVGDQARRFLAAVNPDSGALISAFDAKLGGGYAGVSGLLLAGGNLYVAGDFSTVASQSMARLAALSPTDGSARSWSTIPNPNQPVTVMTATSDTLYVGGLFTQIAGTAFRNFAAFSLADNSLMGVDASLPNFSQGVTALAATPTTLYMGGEFDSAGGEFRQRLACLASFNASAYDWDPALDIPPTTIALTEDLAIIGGAHRYIGRYPTNSPNGFLTVFSRAPVISSARKTQNNTIRLVTTTGDRTDAVIQASPDIVNPIWSSVATNDVPGYSWTAEVPATAPQQFFRTISR